MLVANRVGGTFLGHIILHQLLLEYGFGFDCRLCDGMFLQTWFVNSINGSRVHLVVGDPQHPKEVNCAQRAAKCMNARFTSELACLLQMLTSLLVRASSHEVVVVFVLLHFVRGSLCWGQLFLSTFYCRV